MRHRSRIRGAGVAPLLLCAFLFASCGTREDNGLGLGFIGDRAKFKAVDYVAVAADRATDFQAASQPANAGGGPGLAVGSQSGYLARTLLEFDLQSLAGTGATVDSASVRLVFDGFLGVPSQLAVGVHRVAEDWGEATLPDSFPGLFAAADTVTLARVNGDTLALGDTVAVSVAPPLAQAWVDSAGSNLGLALVPLDDTDLMLEFWSRNSALAPQLVVYWRTPGGADTSATFLASQDLTTFTKTAAFVPLDGQLGRLTVGRGIPTSALLRFALPDLDRRVTVNRALLTLYVDPAMSNLNDFRVRLQRVTDTQWNGDSTMLDVLVRSLATATSAADSVEFDVRDLVADWVREGNEGVMLRALEDRPDVDYFRFHGPDTEVPSLAPVLRVWYTPGDPETEP